MILVTGGTGFIGSFLIPRLVSAGHDVRLLLRPSSRNPNLPKGRTFDVALASLQDLSGLRSAIAGVDTIVHLASSESRGLRADFQGVDIDGTRNLLQAARESGVEHFVYLSHLGADSASAYPLLRAKGIAEQFISNSGIHYTIIRSAVVFGPNDRFIGPLMRVIRYSPGILPVPEPSQGLLQPIWIDDLVSCLVIMLHGGGAHDGLYTVGGAEILSFAQILNVLMTAMSVRRWKLPIGMTWLRWGTAIADQLFPGFPLSVQLFDILAADRIAGTDSLERQFGIVSSGFSQRVRELAEFW